MNLLASSYISSSGAFLNGKRLIDTSDSEENYLKLIYAKLGLDYPKFYKMDNLSKMTLLAECLLSDFYPPELDKENKLQLIFSNSFSSQITDIRFQESYLKIKNPSPSLFVYTLPNILTGELAIKNKLYGENIFFISEKFDSVFFIEQIRFSFNRGNSHCLCGWVESNVYGIEECFLFLMSKSNLNYSEFELMNLLKLYRNE